MNYQNDEMKKKEEEEEEKKKEEIRSKNAVIEKNNESIIKKRHFSNRIISNLFNSQKEFIVLGLCGKTGSGVSEVSNILNTEFEELNLPSPCEESKASIAKTEYRLLYNYAKRNWKQFYKIKTSSLILSRAIAQSKEDFVDFLMQYVDIDFCKEDNKDKVSTNDEKNDSNYKKDKIKYWLDHLYDGIFKISFDNIKIGDSVLDNSKIDIQELVEYINKITNSEVTISGDYEIQITIKQANILFYEYLKKRKNKESYNNFAIYEVLFQYIFVELPEKAKEFWVNLTKDLNINITIMALQEMGNNLRVTKEKPFVKNELVNDGYVGIAELINISIKLLRDYKAKKILVYEKNNERLKIKLDNKYNSLSLKYVLNDNTERLIDSEIDSDIDRDDLYKYSKYLNNIEEEKRTFIVIDSIKNPYESMYLKKRYSNYYLVAVYTDEKYRKDRLEQNVKLEQKDIQAIDITEQLSAFKKIHKDYQKRKVEFEKTINQSKDSDNKEGTDINTGINKNNKTNENDTQKKLKEMIIEKVCQKNERIYNLVSKMDQIRTDSTYPFIMQNIEDCIDSADIFINNKDESESFLQLKKKLLRYVCLIMYPGLVLPSKVERCMQTASTAKLCSGCISRQVGAVLTDNEYNLMAIGWNQQPESQIPCLYRDIIELRKHCNQEAYSDYENDDKRDFQKNIQPPVDNYYNTDKCNVLSTGRSLSYCFKDIYNEITKAKNQVYTRALHAEETAFLNLNKTGAHSIDGGFLFTTSSPCELCSKKAMHMGIKKIYYIQPYPGISNSHVLSAGSAQERPELELFTGAIGRAYTQLYTPLIPKKDEMELWLGHKVSVTNYIKKKLEE